MNVKKELMKRGMTAIDFDSHMSDLYVRVTEVSKKFFDTEYEYKSQVTTFVDQIEHTRWFEVPFANVDGELTQRENRAAMAAAGIPV